MSKKVRLVYEDFELVEEEQTNNPYTKAVFNFEAMPWGPRYTVAFTVPEEQRAAAERILAEFKKITEKREILEEKDWQKVAKIVKKELFKEDNYYFKVTYILKIRSTVEEQLMIKIR